MSPWPEIWTGRPVPLSTTDLSTLLTPSATSLLITRRQLASGMSRLLPVRVVILETMIGLQWMPRAAKVAYASAIESGLTSTVPRVKDGTVW